MPTGWENIHEAIAILTDLVKTGVIPHVADESLELSVAYKILYELGFCLGCMQAAADIG